jgi:GTPase SAR1 family protein
MNVFNKLSKWIKLKFVDEKQDDSHIEYKILVLGEKGVGKSCICTRLVNNEFNLEIKPTVQSECYSKTLKLLDYNIKLYIVDIDENVIKYEYSSYTMW